MQRTGWINFSNAIVKERIIGILIGNKWAFLYETVEGLRLAEAFEKLDRRPQQY